MGDIICISALIPGAKIQLTENRQIIRVTNELTDSKKIEDFKLNFEPPYNIESVKSSDKKNLTFKYQMDIPESLNKVVVLVFCDMKFEGNFTPIALNTIENGFPYVTTLKEPLDPKNPDLEVEIQFGCVLHKKKDGAVLLGILEKAEKKKLRDDENIIAVLDILGFSEMMMNTSINELFDKITNTFQSLLGFIAFSSIGGFVIDDTGNLSINKNLWNIEYGMFEDTVILYLPKKIKGDLKPLKFICDAAVHLIDSGIIDFNWLFRGAISFGGFRVSEENNLYIGTSVVEAHKVEINSEWCGCVLCESVLKKFPEEVDELIKKGLLISYQVPMKDGNKEFITINWAYYNLRNDSKRKKVLLDKIESAPSFAKNKISNTYNYYQYLKSNDLVSIGEVSGPVIGDPTILR